MKFGYEKTVNNRKTQKGSNRRLFDFVEFKVHHIYFRANLKGLQSWEFKVCFYLKFLK